jgi:erythromycin esterase
MKNLAYRRTVSSWRGIIPASFACVMQVLTPGASSSQQPVDTVRLEVGRPVERTFTAAESYTSGTTHQYRVRLEAGQAMHVVVEQRGVDVGTTVYAPDGRQLLLVDGDSWRDGPEPFRLQATATGDYRIEIRPFEDGAPGGRYEVRLVAILSADVWVAEEAARRLPRDSAAAWLTRSGVRLSTVEAGRGFADMAPIGRMVGRARVVALGEATHGTREFFQLKHRMLEYLVARHGFTVFGIEASLPEGFDVNRYVLTGEGDPAAALTGLYMWPWDTEEVLEMIRWMRRWNADPQHRRKVRFYGFDMQSLPRAKSEALAYLRRVDPSEAARAASALAAVASPFTREDLWAGPYPARLRVLDAARSMLARFDERQRAYEALTGPKAWALARQHARIVVQNLTQRLASDSSTVVRDRAMAENVRWILDREGPDARMAIWAHNGHVANDSLWMGRYLRNSLGADMVVFGFAFGRGGFLAVEGPAPSRRGLTAFQVPALADSTLDGMLSHTGFSVAAFDLRQLPSSGPAAEWFAKPHGTRSIGAMAIGPAGSVRSQVVARLYDALIYVDSTTPSRPNAGGGWSPLAPGHAQGGRVAVQPVPAPVNLDFEAVGADGAPSGWTFNAVRLRAFGYRVLVSQLRPPSGQRCVEVRRTAGRHYGEEYGEIGQLIDAAPYRGRRVRVRAMARAETNGAGSEARLWVQSWAPISNVVGQLNTRRSVAVEGATWRSYETIIDVPANAISLRFGFALVGDGRAWVDAVSFDAVP